MSRWISDVGGANGYRFHNNNPVDPDLRVFGSVKSSILLSKIGRAAPNSSQKTSNKSHNFCVENGPPPPLGSTVARGSLSKPPPTIFDNSLPPLPAVVSSTSARGRRSA